MTTQEAFTTLARSAKAGSREEAALKHLRILLTKAAGQRSTDQTLFIRLYAWAFTELCRHYKTTPEDPIPQKELHRILNHSLEGFAEQLASNANLVNMEEYIQTYNRPPLNEYTKEEVARTLKYQALQAIMSYTPIGKSPEEEAKAKL